MLPTVGKGSIVAISLSSVLINILYLTSSLFMLQVYDRVIPSGSIPTLVVLSILAAGLYLYHGLFEVLRSRLLTRVADRYDANLAKKTYNAVVHAPVAGGRIGDGVQAVRDLDQVHAFISGSALTALLDLPWLPLYLVVCFVFHPLIGYVAIFGAVMLIVFTLLTYVTTHKKTESAARSQGSRSSKIIATQRNAEAMISMGMVQPLSTNWLQINKDYRTENRQITDLLGIYGTLSKIFRLGLQSGILGAGAVLVIDNLASPGIIVAGSILTARCLAPVEAIIGNWRNIIAAKQSGRRLSEYINRNYSHSEPIRLPRPSNNLSVEIVAGGAPTLNRPIVADVRFELKAGSAMGVIGPSGCGKSSLSRMLIGVWPIFRGSIRLDGATINQWSEDDRGKLIGYLPQDVELFSGTIAQNISRFSTGSSPESVIAAAKAAGVHELIVGLPQGYDTDIGDGGMFLSAGQRQRVALARSLYGDPFLLVLDEPNSNLDGNGEEALNHAIAGVRQRGGIVVIVAHRPSALRAVDQVLVMEDGRMRLFGPKEEVLSRVSPVERPAEPSRVAGMRIVAEGQGAG
ncbi:type I secretion system permease/ATPase [Rhizobium sp. KDH_Rht_773_N]